MAYSNQSNQLFFGILVAIGLVTNGAAALWAAEHPVKVVISDIASQVSCSQDFPKTLEVKAESSSYLIEIPELIRSPVIGSALVCSLFLEEWAKSFYHSGASEITLELERKRQPTGAKTERSIYRSLSAEPLSSCRELGLCVASLVDVLGLDKRISACRSSVGLAAIFEASSPKFMKANPAVLDKVDIDFFPRRPFSELIIEAASSKGTEALFASTMTIGFGSFKKLIDAFQTPGPPLYMLYDAGLSLIDSQGGVATDQSGIPDRLRPVAITTGAGFENIHHWKGFVAGDLGGAWLTGMNISTPPNIRYLDLVYHIPSKDFARELSDRFQFAIKRQCQDQLAFACLTEAVLGPSKRRDRLRAQLSRGCEAFEQEFGGKKWPQRPRFLMDPQSDDIEGYIVGLIDGAKSKVRLASHKFSSAPIALALLRAKDRGVDVFAVTGFSPWLDAPELQKLFYWPKAEDWVPPIHAKGLTIDDSRIFFGTGNFTTNGLTQARELFVVASDPNAIDYFEVVLDQYRRASGREQPLIAGYAKENDRPPLVVLGKEGGVRTSEAELTELQRLFTLVPTEWWLTQYREVSGEGLSHLRSCGLGGSLILGVEELNRCLQKEVPLEHRFRAVSYPQQPLPIVARDLVKAHFDQYRGAKHKLPVKISHELLDRLAPAARIEFLKLLGKAASTPEALDLAVQRFSQFEYNPNIKQYLQGPQSIARLGIFDRGLGLLLNFPPTSGAVLLLPISGFELRGYSVKDGWELDDKPYNRFYQAIDQVNNPNFFQAWLELFNSGRSDLVSTLSSTEQTLLLDGIAIALSEYFKYYSMEGAKRRSVSGENIFRTVLLAGAFDRGSDSRASAGVASFLGEKYWSKVAIRTEWEELISRKVDWCARFDCTEGGTSLFDQSVSILEKGESLSKEQVEVWRGLFKRDLQ